jgi:mRNA interferase MazF
MTVSMMANDKGFVDGFADGDIVLVDFRPVIGREQDGMRPALVMTDATYNAASSYLVVCPITSNARPWPFKMPLPEGLKVRGFVMLDQIKSIDRLRRVMRLIDRVPGEAMRGYRERLATLLNLAADRQH